MTRNVGYDVEQHALDALKRSSRRSGGVVPPSEVGPPDIDVRNRVAHATASGAIRQGPRARIRFAEHDTTSADHPRPVVARWHRFALMIVLFVGCLVFWVAAQPPGMRNLSAVPTGLIFCVTVLACPLASTFISEGGRTGSAFERLTPADQAILAFVVVSFVFGSYFSALPGGWSRLTPDTAADGIIVCAFILSPLLLLAMGSAFLWLIASVYAFARKWGTAPADWVVACAFVLGPALLLIAVLYPLLKM